MTENTSRIATPRDQVKILIADDSSQNRLTLSAILGDMGYQLVQASSGQQALKYLLDQEFAVVLLDVVMPIMDGFETAKLIRARPKTRHVPIIFISAMSTDEASIYSGYSVGAVDYISTPITPDILKAKVSVFVDLYLKAEEIRRQSEALRALEKERYDHSLFTARQEHEIETLRLKEEHAQRERELAAQTSARLARQAQQLEQSNQELERFAHVVSHDLQEPLNTISLYCQLLERRCREKLSDRELEYLHFVVSGAARMKSLITGLLNYSQVKSEEMAPAELIDLNGLLDRMLGSLAATLKETSATVKVGDLPKVWGQEFRLTQLFQNLVSNALKFRSSQPPEIHVSASQSNNQWTFCVADNGIGIEPSHFENIFVMFKRLHSREKYEGTGVGLALCKKIVEGYGGKIWVESETGGGSKFYFTLPTNAETGHVMAYPRAN